MHEPLARWVPLEHGRPHINALGSTRTPVVGVLDTIYVTHALLSCDEPVVLW